MLKGIVPTGCPRAYGCSDDSRVDRRTHRVLNALRHEYERAGGMGFA